MAEVSMLTAGDCCGHVQSFEVLPRTLLDLVKTKVRGGVCGSWCLVVSVAQ